MKIRDIKSEEVECRVSTISDKGLSLLLYKDARCDMNILDETFGTFGWRREHKLIGDRLYCTVSIYDKETNQWVNKEDVGTESYTEKEKGQASDSFKRACFNIGIGRELYTAPFIWISADKFKMANNKGGKPTTYDRFDVESMEIKDKKIVSLSIKNLTSGQTVFTWGTKTPTKVKAEPKAKNVKVEVAENGMEHYIPLITMQQKQYFMTIYEGKEDKLMSLLEKHGLNSLNDMSQKLASQLITQIESRKKA